MSEFLLVAPILHVCHLRRKSKALYCNIFEKKDFGCFNFGCLVKICEFVNSRFDTKFTWEVTIEHQSGITFYF